MLAPTVECPSHGSTTPLLVVESPRPPARVVLDQRHHALSHRASLRWRHLVGLTHGASAGRSHLPPHGARAWPTPQGAWLQLCSPLRASPSAATAHRCCQQTAIAQSLARATLDTGKPRSAGSHIRFGPRPAATSHTAAACRRPSLKASRGPILTPASHA